jgi:hypothetical protein
MIIDDLPMWNIMLKHGVKAVKCDKGHILASAIISGRQVGSKSISSRRNHSGSREQKQERLVMMREAVVCISQQASWGRTSRPLC